MRRAARMDIARRALTVALALAASAPLAAAQNLVLNGGFESPFIAADSLTLAGCPPGFVWCVGQGTVDLVQAGWQPGEGRQSLDLNGASPGSIYQDLATVAGQTYDVSFLFSGHPDGDPTKTMRVFWGGADLGQFTWIVGPGQSRAEMFWSPIFIRELTATSATTRLEFRSTTTAVCGDPAAAMCGPALDAVSVAAVTAIPEPATLLLLGGGLAVLAASALRRRRPG